MRPYFELRIWKEAHSLAILVHAETENFPPAERYRLVDQMRRASRSVAAVIAEGTGRRTVKEFASYLYTARGSAHEMLNHCLFSREVGYCRPDVADKMFRRYRGLAAGIYGYIQMIEKTNA